MNSLPGFSLSALPDQFILDGQVIFVSNDRDKRLVIASDHHVYFFDKHRIEHFPPIVTGLIAIKRLNGHINPFKMFNLNIIVALKSLDVNFQGCVECAESLLIGWLL